MFFSNVGRRVISANITIIVIIIAFFPFFKYFKYAPFVFFGLKSLSPKICSAHAVPEGPFFLYI